MTVTSEGLLMRLVIFENTIFQLNSLNITVFVCHVSESKVNRKERNRPSLFVCFLFHLAKYIIISEHVVSSCQCPVWGLKRAQELCVDLHDHGNHNSPSHKLFATKYCFLIPGDDTSFFFFISLSYFTLLLIFIKIVLLLLLFYFIFFHENYFYFFMFRDVPECSGMFRNVPCSGFYRRPPNLRSTVYKKTHYFFHKMKNIQF